MSAWIIRAALLLGFIGALAPVAAGRPSTNSSLEEILSRARDQMARGEVDPAIQSLTLAREASPADATVYALLAAVYLKQGAEPMALLQFEKSIELDSTQTDVRLQLASLYAKNRRWQDTGRQYQHVLHQDPANDAAATELGRLYLKAKQPEKAARVLQPYVERHPGDEVLAGEYLSALESTGQWASLAAAADRILVARADWTPALRGAAHAKARLGQCEQALAQFLRLNGIEPLGASDAVLVGSCYVAQKDDAQAVTWFERLLQAADPALDWAEPAAAFMRMKRWQDAAMCYERKAAQDSTSVSALLNYALCKQQLKDYEASRTALRRVVAKKPDSVKSRYCLATTYVLMDSTRAARREYSEVLRLAAGRESEFRDETVQSYRYLSVVHLLDQNWGPAVQALDAVLRYEPGDVEMRLYRAQALFALNRKSEAREEFQSVLRRQPGNPQAKKGLDLLAQHN